jgi:acyl-CoA reductase-like NAD-dependent aldehyde dehydrogenase
MKQHYREFYINGEWTAPVSERESISVLNPSTEEEIARIPQGDASDIEAAVRAAKNALPSWSSTSTEYRADLIEKISTALDGRRAEFAELISRDEGMPLSLSDALQAGLPITTFADTARNLRAFQFEERIDNSLVVREPIGVVGCITPWNFPLHQIAAKVAPALAAGCTVVVKPSEVAPLNAYLLAEIMDELSAPAGVFNMVTGYGEVVGEALATHPDVDMVSFTGSSRAGRRVMELAAQSVKRVSLELGGKSANVILDDADVPAAVESGIGSAFLNAGQSCSALTRFIVPRSLLSEVEDAARAVAETYVPGDPFEPASTLGPMVSSAQQERVRGYIRAAIDDGTTLITGGPEQPEQTPMGYFVRPTVFSSVDNKSRLAQEEVFGPVLAIIPYDTVDEAVEMANDTAYGLAGAVWSGSRERAIEVARRLRTGQVQINGGDYNPRAPFGGYKQSGNGREFGPHALTEFTELKAMQLDG